MKKIVYFGFFVIVLVIISSASINYLEFKKNMSISQAPITSAASTVHTNTAVDGIKKNKNCPAVDMVYKKLSELVKNNSNEQLENILVLLEKYSSFEMLEKSALQNDECGASAASYLSNFYSDIKMQNKSNEYHQQVLKFANANNSNAIENLCRGYDSLTKVEEKLHFCQIVINDDSKFFDDSLKLHALIEIGEFYFASNQGDKLFNLCEKNNNIDMCMFSRLFTSVSNLADKLYEEKKYEEAIKLYKKIEPYDLTGLTQNQLGDMYLNGEGTVKNLAIAIFWYKKALEKIEDANLRAEEMVKIGVSYYHLFDYPKAFQWYQQAAFMNNSTGQLNLGLMHLRGYGTLKDNENAYAWISIAITQGLGDSDRQAKAENIKNGLAYNLRTQDQTGEALKQAEDLAQQYYKKYVLHEQPPTKKSKSFREKLTAAMNIFKN